MQIGSASTPEEAHRDFGAAGEDPNSPDHSVRSYDPRGESFGAPPEVGLQNHHELRHEPSSWRESRVNGRDDGSSVEDYVPVSTRDRRPVVGASHTVYAQVARNATTQHGTILTAEMQ